LAKWAPQFEKIQIRRESDPKNQGVRKNEGITTFSAVGVQELRPTPVRAGKEEGEGNASRKKGRPAGQLYDWIRSVRWVRHNNRNYNTQADRTRIRISTAAKSTSGCGTDLLWAINQEEP